MFDQIFLGESVEDGGSTKYYIGNRQKYLQRWDKRDIKIEATTMYDIEMKQSIHAKLAEATKTGYTGLTLLYRLHKLYKFNPFEDMVHDVMHLDLLNCCKKLFKRIFTEYVDQFNEDMSNFPLTPGNILLVLIVFYWRDKTKIIEKET